ncbi:hypothetical protein [Anaerosacchariphilus polymeriproducens]|uniref:ESAT-6-like protein n=1 Tax=Anaerosacchariphilus polymeriproducens TaxID=1812858 RepID=A0A371ARR1_9FIRM|nr:hypothetical protein [Anaerosacchariphilus polymeriproducens]RDU22255.1 hypothetical protein DWV06_17190 [Anaerosacchariphilus polymeriproducens]
MGNNDVIKINPERIKRSASQIPAAKAALENASKSYINDTVGIFEEFNSSYADSMIAVLDNMRDIFDKKLLLQLEQYEKGVEDVVKMFEDTDADSEKNLREIAK